jgi:4-hydroxy-tetrahydrodipicolinate synthase
MLSGEIKGAYTALVTPFTEDGRVDIKSFEQFIDWQIAEGIHGLVPCGTTGESPTLSHQEHMMVVETCVKIAAGRVPVMAGAGSNSTEEAIVFAKHAEKAGANSILCVAPYYNKPNQEGLYQHYKAINDAVGIPIILYNIPGRSVINISDETIAKLAELPNIAGVKDATGDLERPLGLRMMLGMNDFVMLSGEDSTALAFNVNGGQGCISVTSNVAPRMVAELQNLWNVGDLKSAMRLSQMLYPLHRVMFSDTNPIPVKFAVSLLGLTSPKPRLPLIELDGVRKAQITSVMEKLGILANTPQHMMA